MLRKAACLLLLAVFTMLLNPRAEAQYLEGLPGDGSLPPIDVRPAGPGQKYALICVTANNFYFGGQLGGLELPEEVLQDELDYWTDQCGSQALALQDRDGFPAQGLLAYYQLRQTGCSDANITFMLWHDDEPGDSHCERPVNNPDNNDGALVGGGDEWIDYDGDGENDLDGIDTDGDGNDDLTPVIDYENDDPRFPGQAVTVNNFIAEVWNIAAQATPQDEVYIYLVGHGVRLLNEPGAPVMFMFEAGQATPNNPNDDGITDSQFYSLINSAFGPGRGPHVTVMADSCYSGRFIRSEQAISSGNWDSEYPRVVVSGNTVHVVWQDERSGPYEVYYRRSDDGGLTWAVETQLSDGNTTDSLHPAIAVNGNKVHVVWDDTKDYGNPTTKGEIFYRRSTDGGQSWGAVTRMTVRDNIQSVYPDVGVNGDYVHVVWHDHRDYGPGFKAEVYYKRSTDAGANWGNDTRLTNSDAASELPRLAVVGSWIHLAWYDTRNFDIAEVYYMRSSDNGASWGNDRRISDQVEGCDSWNADIAAAGNNVYIIWEEDLSCYGDPDTEIQMRCSSDNGNTFGPADGQQVSRWDRNVEAPAIALRDPDKVYAVWAEDWNVQGLPVPGPGQCRDIAYHWSHDSGDRLYQTGWDELLTSHFDNTGGAYVGDTETPDLCMTNSRSHFVWSDQVGNTNREIMFRVVPFQSIWMSAAGDLPALYYMEASSSSHQPDAYAGSFMFYRFWRKVDGSTALEQCYWAGTLEEIHNCPLIGDLPTMFIQFPDYYLDYSGKAGDLTLGCENLLVWSEDFGEYELGSGMHGQGGWKGWDNDSDFDAYVTDAQFRSYPHSVDIADDSDLVHEYDGYTSGKWKYTAWQCIPADFASDNNTPFDPGTYFLLLNKYDDGGPYNWSVQYIFDSNDGMCKVSHGDGHDTIDVPYVTDRWVKIEVFIDLDADEVRVHYDGEYLAEYTWTDGIYGDGGGALDVAAVDLFANGSSSVYYDDVSLRRILDP